MKKILKERYGFKYYNLKQLKENRSLYYKTMINEDPKIQKFISQRNELYTYITTKVIPFKKKFKLVPAPVKSGKRGMVEIYSLVDKSSKHIFLTALHRRADESQRKELASYEINVNTVHNKDKKDKCIEYIDELLNKKEIVKIHLDELDFGCGNNQLLGYIWTKYKANPNVYFILYSATIEVAKKVFLQVNNIDDFYECEKYVPPPIYFGINKYLQHKKFFQAVSFIDYDSSNDEFSITQQGEELIQKLISNTNDDTNKRHIAVLRLAGNFKINKKQISRFDKMKEYKDEIEEKYGIRLKFVGTNDNTVEWDNIKYWEELSPSLPFIIVINQVSGRSTEWKCHPFIVWYHTLRTDETPTGTIIQDQERPVYYTTNYTDEINIEIYGDLPCAKYSAGHITLQQMLTMTSRKLNARLDTKTKKNHIDVTTELYDTWDLIPQNYKKGKSLSTHVNEDNILKHKMSVIEKINGVNVKNEYEITNWDKHSHLEGFYMTNIRSSRINFIKGKKSNNKAIWFKSDVDTELKEGINEKSRIRINLYYPDGETDPSKYKFIVRKFNGSKQTNCSNTTMYNT
jgi:hypothetical protein